MLLGNKSKTNASINLLKPGGNTQKEILCDTEIFNILHSIKTSKAKYQHRATGCECELERGFRTDANRLIINLVLWQWRTAADPKASSASKQPFFAHLSIATHIFLISR